MQPAMLYTAAMLVTFSGAASGALADEKPKHAEGKVVVEKMRPGAQEQRQLVVRMEADHDAHATSDQAPLRIGVSLQNPSDALAAQLGVDAHKSLLIAGVEDDAPAAKAGLQRFDVIVSVDNDKECTMNRLMRAIQGAGDGGQVALHIIREGEDHIVRVSPTRARLHVDTSNREGALRTLFSDNGDVIHFAGGAAGANRLHIAQPDSQSFTFAGSPDGLHRDGQVIHQALEDAEKALNKSLGDIKVKIRMNDDNPQCAEAAITLALSQVRKALNAAEENIDEDGELPNVEFFFSDDEDTDAAHGKRSEHANKGKAVHLPQVAVELLRKKFGNEGLQALSLTPDVIKKIDLQMLGASGSEGMRTLLLDKEDSHAAGLRPEMRIGVGVGAAGSVGDAGVLHRLDKIERQIDHIEAMLKHLLSYIDDGDD